MKKIRFIAYAGAIALLSTGFASCASNDEIADQNPTYDPVEKTVTTQFVLNIASSEMPETRQSATTVQKAKNFRGMQDAKLIGLSTGKTYDPDHPTYWLAPFAGTSTGYTVNKTYDLGTLYGTTAVDNNPESDNAENSSHRVVELTLPVQTDAMLVYGRAIPGDDVEENGKVVYAVNATPESTTFSLVSRLGDNSEAYTQTCNLAALLLNRVMLSQVAAHPLPETPTPRTGYTQKADMPALSWRELGTKTDAQIAALAPLQENLATAYKIIQTTYSDGSNVHAGSAASVCNVVKDIYAIATSVADATATNDNELNAQRLADVILARIRYYFDTTSDPFTFKNLGEVDTDGTPKHTLVTNQAATAADFASGGKYAKVTDALLKNFPKAFNLPEGVSQLEFTAFVEGTPITGGFAYKTLANSHSLIDIANALNPEKYTYPAELLYFDNSLLRVTDSDKDPGDYPNGYNVWDTESQWSDWTIGKVASTTRSVAVKNNINYGVAMLQTKVTIDNSVTDFLDNHPAPDNFKISATEIKGFTLTGVLVGGQYKQVGWNFLSTGDGTSGANKDFVIFDNKIPSGTVPTPTGSENYTLVFDNYAGSPESDVLVALEFKNGNDKDIYGKGGMIPKGGTFYLVGKLLLASPVSGSTITWPTTYAIPPYDANGESTKTTRVFIQDYMTTATFTIGAESLKNAYTTVPDLRASQTSLGLSVDLNWRPGLSFEATLGQ
jgi:hypothetical protein